jgi:sugar lactone lactonase YvrE
MSDEPFSIERLYRALASQVRESRWSVHANSLVGEPPLAVHSILRLPPGDHPEGVAVDRRGNVYVSNRRFVGSLRQAEVLRIDPDNRATVVARLPDTADPRGNGVLGLVTDRDGNVYAALDSRDPASRGVWRIDAEEPQAERLAGSEQMTFPNALTFDATGNLYATDSETGAIWRFRLDRSPEPALWAQDELLAPFPFDPFGIPLPTGELQPLELPGANGIAFFPPNHLYVANTEKALVVHVPIKANGGAGQARIVAGEAVPSDSEAWLPDPRLWTIDGIAMDAHGDIYGVIPASPVISQVSGLSLTPLVRIHAASGEVCAVRTDPGAFHIPLSLAFGRGARDRSSVFVTNSALFAELFPGPGPGMIRAEAGGPGFDADEAFRGDCLRELLFRRTAVREASNERVEPDEPR